MNVLRKDSGDQLGSIADPWAEVHGSIVYIAGTPAAKTNRALDTFGATTDTTDLDATTLKHGLMSKLDKIKLDAVNLASITDGDMLKSVYDPTNINASAFALSNHTGTLATSQIADSAVTLAKMANAATGTMLGRATAGTGVVEYLTASQVRTLLGLGSLATQSGTFSGTSSGTNTGDQDLSGLAVKSANLSDLASAATARTNLGLGGAAVLAVGTTAGTVAAGDHTHAQLHDALTLAGTPDYLTLAGQVLTRRPIDLATDVTGILPHGNLGTGGGGSTKFLREDGTFQALGGGGDALVASNLDQFADVTQTGGTTLAISASTTLSGGSHSGTNTGDQDLSGLAVKSANLSDLASASTARTNLGLGTLATQSGTFSGTSSGTNTGDQDLSGLAVKSNNLSDLTSAATARSNLGLVIGTNVQAYDAQLDSLSGLAYAGNALKVVQVNNAETAFELVTKANGDLLAASNLSDLTNAAAARTNLGLGSLATQSGTFSGTSSGTNTGDQTNITGNAATVTTNANLTGPVTSVGNATSIANGAISNAMLANGAVANLSGTNTGDQTPTSLGLVIGTHVQGYDAQLADLAGLSYTGNALKVARVNAGETSFELASVSVHDALTLGASLTDVLSLSGQVLSAVDAGSDKLKMWDDSAGKETYATIGQGLTMVGTTISTLTQTATKTAAYTAVAGEHVIVDSSAAAGNFTVTMPASPTVGQQVRVTMLNDHATRVVTIDGNGSDAIETDANNSPGKYTLVLEGDSVLLEWVGGGCGWAVIADQITPHVGRINGAAAQTTNTAGAWTKSTQLSILSISIGGISASNIITVRRSGAYAIYGFAYPNSNTGASVVFYGSIYLNGTSTAWDLNYLNTSTTAYTSNPSNLLSLAAGDYIELYFLHSNANVGLASYSQLYVSEIR